MSGCVRFCVNLLSTWQLLNSSCLIVSIDFHVELFCGSLGIPYLFRLYSRNCGLRRTDRDDVLRARRRTSSFVWRKDSGRDSYYLNCAVDITAWVDWARTIELTYMRPQERRLGFASCIFIIIFCLTFTHLRIRVLLYIYIISSFQCQLFLS